VLSQINGCNGSYTNTDDLDVARHISGVPLPVLRRSPDVSELPHMCSVTRLRDMSSRVLTDVTEDECGCKRIETMVLVKYVTSRVGAVRVRGEANFDYNMKIEECGTSLPLSFIGTKCRVRVRQLRTRCGCADVTFSCELQHKFSYLSLLPGHPTRYRVYTHHLASRQLVGVCQRPTEHVARSQISGNQGSWTNSDDVKSDSSGGGGSSGSSVEAERVRNTRRAQTRQNSRSGLMAGGEDPPPGGYTPSAAGTPTTLTPPPSPSPSPVVYTPELIEERYYNVEITLFNVLRGTEFLVTSFGGSEERKALQLGYKSYSIVTVDKNHFDLFVRKVAGFRVNSQHAIDNLVNIAGSSGWDIVTLPVLISQYFKFLKLTQTAAGCSDHPIPLGTLNSITPVSLTLASSVNWLLRAVLSAPMCAMGYSRASTRDQELLFGVATFVSNKCVRVLDYPLSRIEPFLARPLDTGVLCTARVLQICIWLLTVSFMTKSACRLFMRVSVYYFRLYLSRCGRLITRNDFVRAFRTLLTFLWRMLSQLRSLTPNAR